ARIVKQGNRRQLKVMAADGTSPRTLAASIDIQGPAGEAAVDWSPDGKWIAAGGIDADGPALFKIPVDGGKPLRLFAGPATNPIWSPDDRLILYAGPFFAGQAELLAVRPDGSPFVVPPVRVHPGGYRFR